MTEDQKKIMDHINAKNKFLEASQMRVVEISDGYARVECFPDENAHNMFHFVHGGVIFSLADTAAGAASQSSGRSSVTLSSSIDFIRPCRTGKMVAEAHEVSSGRSTGVYDVQVFDGEGKLLSKALFSMFFVEANGYHQ